MALSLPFLSNEKRRLSTLSSERQSCKPIYKISKASFEHSRKTCVGRSRGRCWQSGKLGISRLSLYVNFAVISSSQLTCLQSSFKAEEAYAEGPAPSVDEAKLQHAEELEALLVEYKTLNDTLTERIQTLEAAVTPPPKPTIPFEELEKVEKENLALKTSKCPILPLDARLIISTSRRRTREGNRRTPQED